MLSLTSTWFQVHDSCHLPSLMKDFFLRSARNSLLFSRGVFGWRFGNNIFVPSVLLLKRNHWNNGYSSHARFFRKPLVFCFASSLLVSGSSRDETSFSQVRHDLPHFTIDEVKRHSSKETGVWVVLGRGVYDVTRFIENHPGGETILLAAGQSLEPFWSIYAQHHTRQVYDILESYRIGNLDEKSIG